MVNPNSHPLLSLPQLHIVPPYASPTHKCLSTVSLPLLLRHTTRAASLCFFLSHAWSITASGTAPPSPSFVHSTVIGGVASPSASLSHTRGAQRSASWCLLFPLLCTVLLHSWWRMTALLSRQCKVALLSWWSLLVLAALLPLAVLLPKADPIAGSSIR